MVVKNLLVSCKKWSGHCDTEIFWKRQTAVQAWLIVTHWQSTWLCEACAPQPLSGNRQVTSKPPEESSRNVVLLKNKLKNILWAMPSNTSLILRNHSEFKSLSIRNKYKLEPICTKTKNWYTLQLVYSWSARHHWRLTNYYESQINKLYYNSMYENSDKNLF